MVIYFEGTENGAFERVSQKAKEADSANCAAGWTDFRPSWGKIPGVGM
jgi:hypothetical protein